MYLFITYCYSNLETYKLQIACEEQLEDLGGVLSHMLSHMFCFYFYC